MDYIKTYADKVQKIMAADQKERDAISAEIEKNTAIIADAEAAMQTAVDAADRVKYDEQAKIKAEAETAIQWDQLRMDKLRNGHSMDEKDYRAALDGIDTQQKSIDAAAVEKIHALADQIIQTASDADEAIRKGNAVRADLMLRVFRERYEDGRPFNQLEASGYNPDVRGAVHWAEMLKNI